MFVVRLLVLMFLAAYSLSMGQIPSDGLNGFGKLVAFSVVVFVPALYLLPTYEAWRKQHPNLSSIALLNIFLGWTLVGWVASLVWAFKTPSSNPYPSPVLMPREPSYLDTPIVTKPATKLCPFCAEEIMVAAIKCKHCGSDVAAAT